MSEPRMPIWSPSLAAALTLALSLGACHDAADADALVREARQFRDQGDFPAAIIELKNALVRNDRHAEAHRLLGELYVEQGHGILAEQELMQALALGSPAGPVAPLLAKARLLQGHLAQLLSDTIPDSSPAMLAVRGDALRALDRSQEARDSYEKAIARNPSYTPALLGLARLALLEGDRTAATALVTRALLAKPSDADCLRLRGDLLRLDGKHDAAMLAYRKILSARAHDSQALIDIAQLHADRGEFKQARTMLDQILQASPGALPALQALALLDYRAGRLQGADLTVQKILSIAPSYAPTLLLAGLIQASQGEDALATQTLLAFLAGHPGHLQASESLAVLHLRAHRPDAALALVLPLLTQYPGNMDLLLLTAEAHQRARQFSQATTLFATVQSLEAGAIARQSASLCTRLGKGDFERPVIEIERVFALDPSPLHTAAMRVRHYLIEQQLDLALALVRSFDRQADDSLLLDLEGCVHLALQQKAMARRSFEQALALDPAYVPALDKLADLDEHGQNTDASLQRDAAALARKPDDIGLMLATARHAERRGQADTALALLERANRLAPGEDEINHTFARLLLKRHQYDRAVALVRSAQARQPQAPGAYQLEGEVLQAQGQHSRAAGAYAQAFRLARSAPALLQLHQAMSRCGRQVEAGALLDQWLSLHPGDIPVRLALAGTLLQRQDAPRAIAQLERVLKAEPSSVPALQELARCYRYSNRRAAMAYAQRAYRLAPDKPDVLDLLASLLADSGRFERALALLEEAVALAPASRPIRYHLAMTLAEAGDKGAARHALEQVLAMPQAASERAAVKSLLARL